MTQPTPADDNPKRRKMFGPFKIAVVLILLLLVGGGVLVYLYLDEIVRDRVEAGTENSLNLRTSLAGVSLGLLGGDLGLDDLEIASPEGFTAPQMISVGNASVDVSYGQLLADPVRVADVNIDSPKIVIEQAGGKFNLKVVGDRLQTDDAPAEEPLKVIIDHLLVTNAQVEIIPGIPGVSNYTITVPDVELTNIGTADEAQNGAEIGRVVLEVLTAVAAKVAESDGLPPELRAVLKGDLANVLGNVEDMAGEKVDEILGGLKLEERLPGDLGRQVEGEVGNRVREGLGNLLGGNRRDDPPAE